MKHTFTDRERRTPLVLQNVKANRTVGIDVRMVRLCREINFGRLEGVVGREVNRDCKTYTRQPNV